LPLHLLSKKITQEILSFIYLKTAREKLFPKKTVEALLSMNPLVPPSEQGDLSTLTKNDVPQIKVHLHLAMG
jgi:hypothetical protein